MRPTLHASCVILKQTKQKERWRSKSWHFTVCKNTGDRLPTELKAGTPAPYFVKFPDKICVATQTVLWDLFVLQHKLYSEICLCCITHCISEICLCCNTNCTLRSVCVATHTVFLRSVCVATQTVLWDLFVLQHRLYSEICLCCNADYFCYLFVLQHRLYSEICLKDRFWENRVDSSG